MNLKNIMRSLSTPLIVIGAAALVASIALLLAGHSPLSAFSAMIDNLSSADNLVTVVNYASRYYVMGVAVAFGFKMNLFNIGTNGQYQVAALFAGALGGWLRLLAQSIWC
jgi:simple sugar transport system permease protein